MKKLLKVLGGILGAAALNAQAASLVVTFDQYYQAGTAFGPTLSLTFANAIDNDTSFTAADFVSRQWTNLDQISASPFGAYPQSNLAATTPTIYGSISIGGLNQPHFDYGFGYAEKRAPSQNFDPLFLGYESGSTLWGPLLYSAGNGFYMRMYIDSASYDATGTPNSFVAAPVPEPETYAMLLAGLGLLAIAQRRRRLPAA